MSEELRNKIRNLRNDDLKDIFILIFEHIKTLEDTIKKKGTESDTPLDDLTGTP